MPKQTIKRYEHRENGLVIDCMFPTSKARGIIILLDGIPNPGNRREQSSWFARKGYAVLYPKYQGTWESDGRFLDTSPAKDIDRLLLKIANRTLSLPQQLPKHKPIIIASSFGGSVAFSLRSIHLTKRIYCLSPVIDYNAVHGIKTL